MIKNFKDFVNESKEYPPNKNVQGSASIVVEETHAFKTEPILSNLIDKELVTLLGNDVYYYEDDQKTQDILKQYFPDSFQK